MLPVTILHCRANQVTFYSIASIEDRIYEWAASINHSYFPSLPTPKRPQSTLLDNCVSIWFRPPGVIVSRDWKREIDKTIGIK